MSNSDRLLTVDESAEALRCHAATIRRWITENRLPAFRVGRNYRIPAKALETLSGGALSAEALAGRHGE